MKKIALLLFMALTLFLTSCQDNSGEFAEQLYTETEMITACKQCIIACTDSANAHLSIPNSDQFGYANYNNHTYQITFSNTISAILDTVATQGDADLVNNFYQQINTSASSCGEGIKQFITQSLSTIEFANPWNLVEKDSAIISYFDTYYHSSFVQSSKNLVFRQLYNNGVPLLWQNICQNYTNNGHTLPSMDWMNEIAECMVNGFINEMILEEINIRSDSTHRGISTGIMYKVFSTYDK